MKKTLMTGFMAMTILMLSGCYGHLKPTPGHDPDGPGNSENTPSTHSD